MIRSLFLLGILWGMPQVVGAHGSPAQVDVAENKITVLGNVDAPDGYARQVLADTEADAPLVSIVGNRLFTDFPGFDVAGISPGVGLWLEPMAITYGTQAGPIERLLWYWSPSTASVETAPNDQELQLIAARGFGEISVPQFGTSAGSVQFMEPLASDIGQHRHTLFYLLKNSPPAAIGAYGIFARLTSPSLEDSDPFLLLLNHGLSASEFVEAALTINAQAIGIEGDYNNDGSVNAADLAVWQQGLGTTGIDPYALGDGDGDGDNDGADFQVWQRQLGRSVADLQLASSVAVPEPATFQVLLLALLAAIAGFRAGS